MATATNYASYEIFLSCERKSEPLVLKLYKKLTEVFGLRIWFVAVNAADSDNPQPLIKQALESSQIFIACTTTLYSESKECIYEITTANELGLPGLLVLLDPALPFHLPGLKFMMQWPKVKMYENTDELRKWIGTNFEELIDHIEALLNRRFNRPGRERDELEGIFHEMQASFDKSYEKAWKKLEGYQIKENESFTIELQPEGSMKIGSVKGSKFVPVKNQIGNRALLKSNFTKNPKPYKDYETLINFCFKYIGKTAPECLHKEIGGLFTVVQGNPVTIEFLKSQKTVTANQVVTQYFTFMANSVWLTLGYKARKVMISCPPEFQILEKADLKLCLQNAGLDILQVISIPISEAFALNEKNRKNKKGDQGTNKYALIDWNSGTLNVTGYETTPNAPMKVLSSFNDQSLNKQDFEKANIDFVRAKLSNPKEVDLTIDLVYKLLLDACNQFSYGNEYAEVKVSKSNSLIITKHEMIVLCSDYVQQSSQLIRAIMHEHKMKLTDFKRINFCCPVPYSSFVSALYKKAFSDYTVDDNFFVYEENVDGVASAAMIADKKLKRNEESVIPLLDFNFGLRDYSGVFDMVAHRGVTLPTEAETSYSTIRDYQTTVSLKIYSGERPLTRYCDYLGQLTIPNLPKKKAGEVSINVKLTIDESGILIVEAQESSEGKLLKTSIDRSNMKLQKNKSAAIVEALENEQKDAELVRKLRLATGLISKLQAKYRGNQSMNNKIEGFVDTIVKHSDTMDATICDRILYDIQQYA